MQDLWLAVTTGNARLALPAFFPRAAYQRLKAIYDPGGDWDDRLWYDFTLDVAAAHQVVGRGARLDRVIVAGYDAAWVYPGICDNSIGYWHIEQHGSSTGSTGRSSHVRHRLPHLLARRVVRRPFRRRAAQCGDRDRRRSRNRAGAASARRLLIRAAGYRPDLAFWPGGARTPACWPAGRIVTPGGVLSPGWIRLAGNLSTRSGPARRPTTAARATRHRPARALGAAGLRRHARPRRRRCVVHRGTRRRRQARRGVSPRARHHHHGGQPGHRAAGRARRPGGHAGRTGHPRVLSPGFAWRARCSPRPGPAPRIRGTCWLPTPPSSSGCTRRPGSAAGHHYRPRTPRRGHGDQGGGAGRVTVAVGHTDATADVTTAAVDAGATHATHLFNGMRPLHHREPGPRCPA